MTIPSPYRIPGDETPWRKNAVLAFEAEFDTFVDLNMHWGMYNSFFIHENYAYYYKPALENYFFGDNHFSEEMVSLIEPFVKSIEDYLGHKVPEFTVKKDFQY